MNDKFAICRDIFHEFQTNPNYADFRSPVDWKDMGFIDYPIVIKEPMDLSTIDKRLKDNTYITPAEFIYDMRLIYRNCMTYNIESSLLYERGKQFMDDFERRVRETNLFDFKFHLKFQKTEERIKQFTLALQQCNSKAASCVFSVLRTICPECLEKVDNVSYTICIDKMPAETLDYLLEFLISLKAVPVL